LATWKIAHVWLLLVVLCTAYAKPSAAQTPSPSAGSTGAGPANANGASPLDVEALPSCPLLCEPSRAVLTLRKEAVAYASDGDLGAAVETQLRSIRTLGCQIPADLVALADYLEASGDRLSGARLYAAVASLEAPPGTLPEDYRTHAANSRLPKSQCGTPHGDADNLGPVWQVLSRGRRCAGVEARFKAAELAGRSAKVANEAEAECVPSSLRRLVVFAPRRGLEIEIDGKPLEEAELDIALGKGLGLTAGQHQLTARAPRLFEATLEFAVPWEAEADTLTVRLSPFAAKRDGHEPAASAAFDKGLEAALGDDYATAERAFAEAWVADPAAETRFNWAVCALKLGHWDRAYHHLSALADAPDAPPRLVQLSREHLEMLGENRFRRITIVLPKGGTVIVDGRPLAPFPAGGERALVTTSESKPLPKGSYQAVLAEGSHVFRLSPPGESSRTLTHSLKADTTELVLKTPPPEAQLDRVEDGGTHRPLGYTMMAVGGAGLIASSVLFILAKQDLDKVEKRCDDGICNTAEDAELGDRARNRARTSEGLFAAALVLGGAGAYITWGTTF
jgi:hypothetical protein